jgi:Fur family ferric uptake transcriptional regulator
MAGIYNTKQRELVLSAIKMQKKGFLVKDLSRQLRGKIGLTTIYRAVDSLLEEGCLVKLSDENGACYQYIEPCHANGHIYLKCNKCGEMAHVDCEHVRGLSQHIVGEHGFLPSESHVVVNGICKKCIKREEK